jgi:hypothetical protein
MTIDKREGQREDNPWWAGGIEVHYVVRGDFACQIQKKLLPALMTFSSIFTFN